MTEEEMLAMLAEGEMGFEEEEGGGIPWGLMGLGAVGAGAGYMGMDPYRRQLASMLIGGPPDRTRGELWEALATSKEAKGDAAYKAFDKIEDAADRTMAQRKYARTKGIEQLRPSGRELELGAFKKGKVGKGAKTLGAWPIKKSPPGLKTFGRLSAAAGKAPFLGRAMPWLGKALFPGMGWLIAALMAGEGAMYGWKKMVGEPRERRQEDMEGAYGMGQGFERAADLASQQGLADQLEVMAESADLPRPKISQELAQILGGHDLSGLLAQRAPMPKPTFNQALDMVGGE
jgi:hypothetical protein